MFTSRAIIACAELVNADERLMHWDLAWYGINTDGRPSRSCRRSKQRNHLSETTNSKLHPDLKEPPTGTLAQKT